MRKNRGCEVDVYELLERASGQINLDEPLQHRAWDALNALYEFEEALDKLGWYDE